MAIFEVHRFYPCMINVMTPQNVSSPVSAQHKDGRTKLSIFYINDLHGNIDNMSGLVAASDKFDREIKSSTTDTLKISGGDNIAGGDKKKNKLVINLLSRMGINASAVGNHEFDSTISSFYTYLNPDKTKFIAANAKAPNNSKFYNNVQKSSIVEVNGHKYGLIGLLPFDLETVCGKDDEKMEGIRPYDIENSVKIVNDEAEKLTQQGVDKIILITHIGNDKDKEIAPKLHKVDVIVGGHSHTEVKGIEPNKNLFNNLDGDPVLIVQTGENARNAGILNIEFDEKGVPVSAENNLIKMNTEKSPVLSYLKDATLGKSPVVAKILHTDPLPANRRTTPCAWTNFMCDAMREEAGADIAFINAANTRKVPKTGSLTERDISESTPLKNKLLVKYMSEKEIVQGLKDSLKATYSSETGEPGLLHTSGLSYKADNAGNLHELYFVDKNGNKTQIDINNPTDKAYTVCYDSFLAKGTEYPVFVPEKMANKQILKRFDYDKDKCLIDYLKKMPQNNGLSVKDDKRLVIIDVLGKNNINQGNIQRANVNNIPNTKLPAQSIPVSYSPSLTNKLSSAAAKNVYGASM